MCVKSSSSCTHYFITLNYEWFTGNFASKRLQAKLLNPCLLNRIFSLMRTHLFGRLFFSFFFSFAIRRDAIQWFRKILQWAESHPGFNRFLLLQFGLYCVHAWKRWTVLPLHLLNFALIFSLFSSIAVSQFVFSVRISLLFFLYAMHGWRNVHLDQFQSPKYGCLHAHKFRKWLQSKIKKLHFNDK